MVQPFGERAEFAAGGTKAYLCQTGSGRCQVYNRQTRVTRTFTVELPTKPVTAADWHSARGRWLERAPTQIRAVLAQGFDALPRASTFGRFAMVRADWFGRLWVKTYERYRQSTDLRLVVAPTGAAIATVVTPGGFTPLAFEGSELLAETLDEDGVPVIKRYRARIP